MSDIPHRSEPIVFEDLTASDEMRAWMEADWNETSSSSDYTASDYDEINATQGASITMPTSGRVKINNIDGATVTVYMSGSQTIFGESIVLIESQGSVIFKYLPLSDQWVFE